jgi:hypothetical protein
MVMTSDAHAALTVPKDEVARVNKYLHNTPRARTIFDQLKMTTLRVDGAILTEIENLIRRLEQRADAERKSRPVQAGDLQRAAAYLRTLFPPGHPLYRIVYLKPKQELKRLRPQRRDDAADDGE